MQKQKTTYVAKKPLANGMIPYTEEENLVWKTLYKRQIQRVQNRADQSFLDGIAKLNLNADAIPQCIEVSDCLNHCTGWSVKAVEALISFQEFFDMLPNRKFPAASFIRTHEDLNYLMEPDIFHEIFGHCPMLTNPEFAAFTNEVGKLGVKASEEEKSMLARLYWFTAEFGLINTKKGLKIYGGGILSSFGETEYALESDVPNRYPFDLLQVVRTPYRYDEMQKTYFIINSYEDLFQLMEKDLFAIFSKARALGMLPNPHDKSSQEFRNC